MRHLSCAGQAHRLLVPRGFAQHQLIEPPKARKLERVGMLAGWRKRLIFRVGRNTASGRQDGHPRGTADAGAERVVPHSLDLTCKTTRLRATAQSLAVSVFDRVANRAGEPPGSAIAGSVDGRGTLSNWDTNAAGWRNITPFPDWLAQPHRC
jgi:hypothetical protein